MRWLATALWLLATPVWAGSLGSAAPQLPQGTALRDVFPIWGDTQQYARNIEGFVGAGDSTFEVLAQWACDNKTDALGDGLSRVRGVLQMGDIVNDASVAAEWTQYGLARDILEGCATGPVPAVPTQGNHDTVGTTQTPDAVANATLYQQNAGKDQIDGQPWFGGRGAYQERSVFGEVLVHPGGLCDPASGDTCTTPGALIYQENASYGSRSFWINFTNRLKVFSAEYQLGIMTFYNMVEGWQRTSTGAMLKQVTTLDPSTPPLWIFISHAAPCTATGGANNCDQWEVAGGWDSMRDQTPSNVAVFMGGHWNASNAANGQGQFSNIMTRDDGSQTLAGIFDFSSDTADDPEVTAANPYVWQGMLTIDRVRDSICVQTARYLDVDSDNDGTVTEADDGQANPVFPPQLNRVGPGGAPNDLETCIRVPNLQRSRP